MKTIRWTNVVGKTMIDELLYLIGQAKAVITVNTGITHIACAFDRPTLILYVNTNPQHHPWSARSAKIVFDIPDGYKSRNQIIRYVDSMQQEKFPLPSTEQHTEEISSTPPLKIFLLSIGNRKLYLSITGK
ncbi:MAG TPA: glycosyltransferase family 9 protein [Sphingobacterium sp.]|nr:glycosyltransferase family 9 protein [Sphingobacterium sp.]